MTTLTVNNDIAMKLMELSEFHPIFAVGYPIKEIQEREIGKLGTSITVIEEAK